MTDSKLFTRDDIFAMRARYDAGESPREIWRSYPRASLLAVTRAARRETFREIGVGGTERAIVSGRLGGQGNTPRMETSARERAEREVAALPALTDDEPSPEMLERARQSFARATQPAAHPVDAFLAARKTPPRNPLDDDTADTPSDADIAAAEALARHTAATQGGDALLDEMRGDPSKG